MAFPTKPAFIHYGSWDDKTRAHPAMKFMETYTKEVIDARKFDLPYSGHHTDDFTFVTSDGVAASGGDAGWKQAAAVYAPLVEHLHDPYFLSCTETDEGYEMIGQAHLYCTLPGAPAPGETKVKDASGKEWDLMVPGGFHFLYVKDDGPLGYKLKRTEVMANNGAIVVGLLRRGVLKPADLGL